MPFYADFVSDTANRTAPKSCSPVHTLNFCLEEGLKKTHCLNDTSLLGPTLKFFTTSVLDAYRKTCNLTTGSNAYHPLATTDVTFVNKNETQHEAPPAYDIHITDLGSNVSNDGNASKDTGAPLVEDPLKLNTSTIKSDDISSSLLDISETAAKLRNETAGKVSEDKPKEPSTESASEYPHESSSTFQTSKLDLGNNASESSYVAFGVQASNVTLEPNERMRIGMVDPTCEPKLDPKFKYPGDCNSTSLLRRMFTCGVALHEFILHKQDICECFLNYRQCIQLARVELGCANTSVANDPIIVTVKLLESLMMTWYNNPCVFYDDTFNETRLDSVDGCDRSQGAIASVVCYATYFAMSELKTPAPWTSTNDACSAVNDVNRCLTAAEHRSNCTSLRFTVHSRKFLKVITWDKQLECPSDAEFVNVQALGPYVRSNCQRSKALKRALQCALSFQDLADVEHKFVPPQSVPCGHVSRLHTCLEDSVEGTGCFGDITIHSEIKVYKKVLEDAYEIHCVVEGQLDSALRVHSKSKPHIFIPQANKISKQFPGASGLRSWKNEFGLYEHKGDDNTGYYYDDSSDVHKPVFAGPRVLAIQPDDGEEDIEYEKLNSDAQLQKAKPDHGKGGSAWHPLTERQKGISSEILKLPNNGTVAPNGSSPQLLLQFMRHPEEQSARVVVAGQSPEAQMIRERRPGRKGARGTHGKNEEDYFFGNDYVENSELAMFPNGLDMFRHFRGGALMKMESVLANNKSEFSTNDCPLEKVKLALGLCNATLRALLVRWPNISDIGLPLDGSSQGVKQFCSDLNSYKGCLAAVLKSYDCSHGQAISNIFEVYRKKMRLPYCASYADSCKVSMQMTVVGVVTAVILKRFQ